MKNLIFKIFICILILSIPYMAFSFVKMEINASHWTEYERLGCVLFTLSSFGIIPILFF